MKTLPTLCLWAFIAICLSACGEEEKSDTQPRLVRADVAEKWADSLVKTLTPQQKAGQLMLIRLNEMEEVDAALELLRDHQAGGIFLNAGLLKEAPKLAPQFRAASPLPVWIAAELNEEWCSEHRFPGFTTLGQCSEDTLLRVWATHAAQELSTSGINLVFFSSTRLSFAGSPLKGSAGADPLRLGLQATELIRGLREGGLTVVEQPFPLGQDLAKPSRSTFPVLRRSIASLAEHEMQAACWAIGSESVAFQLPAILLTTTDSKNPVTASDKVVEPLFRQALSFNGLLFSASLSDYILLRWKPAAALALSCINAGAEVLVDPAEPLEVAAFLGAEAEKSSIGLQVLNQRAKKVLLARARTVREGIAASQQRVATGEDSRELMRRLVYSHSLVILRNRNNLLPLGPYETKKVAAVSVGLSAHGPFQQAMALYFPCDFHLLAPTATAAQLKTMSQSLSRYALVTLSLHLKPGESLSEEFIAFLKDLDKQRRLVVVHLGDGASLRGLDLLSSVVHAPENMPLCQQFAAELLCGALPARSRLALDVSHGFCTGEGLMQSGRWRLRWQVRPEEAGIDSRRLVQIDSLLQKAVKDGVFPGCQVLVARRSQVIYHKSFGFHDYTRQQRVLNSHLYDIASVTKMAATTLAVMKCYDQDSLKLEGTLKDYVPGMDTTRLKDLRIEDILIHKAGLPPALPVYYFYTVLDSVDSIRTRYYSKTPSPDFRLEVAKELYFATHGLDSVLTRVGRVKPYGKGTYEYSDLGFFLLKTVVEAIGHQRIDSLVEESFYRPMGLKHITFNPLKKFSLEQVCPTEDDKWFRLQLVHGYVHDQAAALLGGISGHAGLFSNASDLAVIMQMLLNRGSYGGTRYFESETVDLFTSRHRECYRGLGFDHQTSDQQYTMVCTNASPDCFGHTGFTGTCVWADPQHELVYIFLSNRVHPDAKNQKINQQGIRQAVQRIVYEAMGVEGPDRKAPAGGTASLLSQGDSTSRKLNDSIVP